MNVTASDHGRRRRAIPRGLPVAIAATATAVLTVSVIAVPDLQADERRATLAAQEREATYREAVLRVVAEAEKVLDPVLLAAAGDSPAADEIRADVYQLGDANRDLDDRRGRLDAAAPPKRWAAAHDGLERHLAEASAALTDLEAVGSSADDWNRATDRLAQARDGWQAVLKEQVLEPGQQLPSAMDAEDGATRAASILRFDLVCEDARDLAGPDRVPSTVGEAVRFFEAVDANLSRLASGLLGVEVPAYERSFVESNVHLPAQQVLDQIGPVTERLTAAITAGDRDAVVRELRGSYTDLEADLAVVADGLDAYGATVCSRYLGTGSASGVPDDAGAAA